MKILDKKPKENSRAYALRVLTYNIIQLELSPAELISENEISSLLGLSRTPVREALIELSKYGLVDIVPKKGSYVSKIDYDIIEESRFMRVVLENAILKILCTSIAPEFIDQLKKNIKEQKSAAEKGDDKLLFELDNNFHKLLFEAAGKTWTYNVISNQMMYFDRLRSLTLKTVKSDRIVDDHENIIYAIERQDKELAEMLMTKHLGRHQIDKIEILRQYPSYFVEKN